MFGTTTSREVWHKRLLLALNSISWSLPLMAVTGLDAFNALSLSAMAWTWLTAEIN